MRRIYRPFRDELKFCEKTLWLKAPLGKHLRRPSVLLQIEVVTVVERRTENVPQKVGLAALPDSPQQQGLPGRPALPGRP